MIDTKKLVQEIKEVAETIQATKKVARTHRHADQWSCQCALPGLKHRATLLCSLRAHMRKRVHAQGSTLEAQEKLVKSATPTCPCAPGSIYAEFESQEAGTSLTMSPVVPPPQGVAERAPAIANPTTAPKSFWRAARRLLGAA